MSSTGNGDTTIGAPPGLPTMAAALSAAALFIDGVVWGDHNAVWDLIGVEGRTEVLEVATKRGMDENLAARLSSGAAAPAETNEFLLDLVNGLRSELAGNDLDNISFEPDEAESTPERAAVRMLVPLHPLIGGTLPIGTLFLVAEGGGWKVERLIPLTSK